MNTLRCFSLLTAFIVLSHTVYADPSNTLLGLPTHAINSTKLSTPAEIDLGKQLFFDKNLSQDGSVSCASCHAPDKAFSDHRRVAQGIRGQFGTRNTPTLLNAAFAQHLFWDGRRERLEDQVLDPFINPVEQGLANLAELEQRVRLNKTYPTVFRRVYGLEPEAIDAMHIAWALAAYVRSLLAGDSPFDRYLYAGDRNALSADALRGLELFRGRAHCVECHVIGSNSAFFADNQFHRLGVGLQSIQPRLAELAKRAATYSGSLDALVLEYPEIAELGRFLATHDPHDLGKFKTPSLRNVALTAPYMHDGSIATLEEAVEREVYYRGLSNGRPLIITPREKMAIVEFLKSLTSSTREQR